jgi:hypothetical protein
MKYREPSKIQNEAVERIYKYIKEIKETNSKPSHSREFSSLIKDKQSCCFQSKTKKCSFENSNSRIPGPGTYHVENSLIATDKKPSFGTSPKGQGIINQNNTLIIKGRDDELPGVGRYFGNPRTMKADNNQRNKSISFASNLQRNCMQTIAKTDEPGPGEYDIAGRKQIHYLHKGN